MKKLEKTNENNEKTLKIKVASQEPSRGRCPECNSKHIIVVGRCLTCLSCGWSLCSM